MPLDPPIQVLLDFYNRIKPPPGLSIEERRRLAAESTPVLPRSRRPPGLRVDDHQVAVDGGEITLRVLRPEELDGPGPGYVFIHGGGWTSGDIDSAESECGSLAKEVGATVVVVDYRLAPEHKFPVPLLDCLAAYRWVVDEAPQLGIDFGRLVLSGGSAGGNLAAALCLLIRDNALPMPCLQFLDVPALDLSLGSPSATMMDPEAWLSGADLAEAVGHYLRTPEDALDPLASPLLATDLSGLPPAVILVAEYDPVRDDGERYARRLHEAGVPAAVLRIVTHAHGTYGIQGTLTAGLMRDLRINALRRAFDGTLIGSPLPLP